MTTILSTLLHTCSVRITVENSPQTGSGFFIAPGQILTCANIVGERRRRGRDVFLEPTSATITIQLADNELLHGQIQAFLPALDSALLTVPFVDHPCVYLDPTYTLRNPVRCFGFLPQEFITDTTMIRAEIGASHLRLDPFEQSVALSGAPILNERTGAVCAMLIGARAIDREHRARINRLYAFVTMNCGLEDVKMLCMSLGMNYEHLSGTSLGEQAIALIARLDAEGRTDELIKLVTDRGVNLPWQENDLRGRPGDERAIDPQAAGLLDQIYESEHTRAIPIKYVIDAVGMPDLVTAQQAFHAAHDGWIKALTLEQREQPGPCFPLTFNQPQCPYPGLRPFNEEEQCFFYGRGWELKELMRLLESNLRIIVVSGHSGTGKSSLIAAGLRPALERQQPDLRLIQLRLGEYPATELRAGLQIPLDTPPDACGAAVDRLLKQQGHTRLLLIIDQFEELFIHASKSQSQIDLVVPQNTVPTLAEQQLNEVASMLTALRTQAAAIKIILVIRDDFWEDLNQINLVPQAKTAKFVLGPLHVDDLRRAIRQPAENLNVPIEHALVEHLIYESGALDNTSALPFIQLALHNLWSYMQRGRLTKALYDTHIERLADVIELHADGVMESLTSEEYVVARQILVRLVSFGEGYADTRRQLQKHRLRSPGHRDCFEKVFQHLLNRRLILINGEGESARVEIAHEAIVRHWKTFQDWLTGTTPLAGQITIRDAERRRRELERLVEQWQRRSIEFIGAMQIEEAQTWHTTFHYELGDVEGLDTLLAASEKHLGRQRTLTVLTIMIVFGLFIMILFCYWLRMSPAILLIFKEQ